MNMKNTNPPLPIIKGLIGCDDCDKKGSNKRKWLTTEESFDLSITRLASRRLSTYGYEQVCAHCKGTRFYCYAVKGFELNRKVPLSDFQRRGTDFIDIDEQIDKTALISLMRHDRLTSFAEGVEHYKQRLFGTWTDHDAFVIAYLEEANLLSKIPPEVVPFLNLDKYSEMLIDDEIIVYLQDGRKIWVFWTNQII